MPPSNETAPHPGIRMMVKTCTKCGEVKPLDDFYLHKGKPYSQCKPCKLECDHAYYYRNLDKKREYEKMRYIRDGEKRRSLQRQLNLKYSDEVRERDRARYARHAEIVSIRESQSAKKKNDISKSFQTVKNKHWSEDEDRILMKEDDRTVYQKAIELGRSYHGARARKTYLKKELKNVST